MRIVDGDGLNDLTEPFETGAIIVFPRVPLTHFKALQAIPIHAGAKKIKTKDRKALRQLGDETMFEETEIELRAFVHSWFPAYGWTGEQVTYRYTVTGPEFLHFDYYATPDVLHVRLFVNVDTEPRVWGVGPDLVKWCERHGIRGGTLSERAYRATHDAPLAQEPMERVEFPPGSGWIVNAQRVAHAILHGRRMVATSYLTDRPA